MAVRAAVVAVAAGQYHSLALCSDGTVAAEGSNANGQLGNGGTATSATPVATNLPGTDRERPNWRHRAKLNATDQFRSQRARAILATVAAARPKPA